MKDTDKQKEHSRMPLLQLIKKEDCLLKLKFQSKLIELQKEVLETI